MQVCDAELALPGPKPVPCQNPTCNFAFDELGLGSGISELYQCPDVADLLISMAASAMICPDVRPPSRPGYACVWMVLAVVPRLCHFLLLVPAQCKQNIQAIASSMQRQAASLKLYMG